MMRRLRLLLAAASLAAVPAAGTGAEWDWLASGLVDARAYGGRHDATRLVPDPALIGRGAPDRSAVAVAGVEAWRGPLAVSGRLRARGVPGEGRAAGRRICTWTSSTPSTPSPRRISSTRGGGTSSTADPSG